MATNKIEDRLFISLMGEFVLPSEDIEVTLRPGIDGLTFVRLGKRGHPFRIHSVVDAESYSQAQSEMEAYYALVGANPVGCIKNDFDFEAAFSMRFEVINVMPLSIRKQFAAVGGLRPPSEAIVEAEWELVAVPVAEDDE